MYIKSDDDGDVDGGSGEVRARERGMSANRKKTVTIRALADNLLREMHTRTIL